jgi:hydrogenase maturation protease
MANQKSILVVGVGNLYRCDDRIGLLIAEQLRKILPEQVEVISHSSDGLSLIDLWKNFDCVYLIDAVHSGGSSGKVYRFDAIATQLPINFFKNYSTHSFDIPATIALAKNLNSLPEELIIYGVESKNFHLGSQVSDEVRKAGSKVSRYIKKEIKKQMSLHFH